MFLSLLFTPWAHAADLSSATTPPPLEENQPVPQDTVSIGELWTGKAYTSTFRAGICFDEQKNARGVLIITLQSGKENVYHFSGNMDQHGVLRLKHPSGHKFKGSFEDDSTVRGKGTTKNGFSVELVGKRHRNVPLSKDKCRPLSE